MAPKGKQVPQVARPRGPTTLESISDKELLAVFSLLSICDLRSLELVSRRLRKFALLACRERRSLCLIHPTLYRDELKNIARYCYFTDYSTQHQFGRDCFPVSSWIGVPGVRWIVKRYPKVTQLTIYCLQLRMESFEELLKSYPLERLALFACYYKHFLFYDETKFWTALYGLRATLCHLKLPQKHDLHIGHLTQLFSPTLKSLFLDSFVFDRWMFDNPIAGVEHGLEQSAMHNIYRTMTDAVKLSFFELARPEDVPNQAERENDWVQVLTRRGLYFADPRAVYTLEYTRMVLRQEIRHILNGNDRHLSHLDLVLPCSVGLLNLLPYLVRLTRLTHIRLTEGKTGDPPQSVFFEELDRTNYRTKLGQPNRTVMPNIRQLNLYQFEIVPSNGIFLYLSAIFPQITTLHLEDCHMVNTTRRQIFPGWFLDSMARFGQLREVFNNYRLVLQMDRAAEERDELRHLVQTEIFDKARM